MMAGLRLLRFTNGLKYSNKWSAYESHLWPQSRVFMSSSLSLSLSCKVGRISASKTPEVEVKVEVEVENGDKNKGTLMAFFNSEDNSALISASLIGILTGFSVVIFNNLVHELRDFFWDGIPYRGASWLREQPLESSWQRIIFVPVFGGFLVSMLNALRDSLDSPSRGDIVPKVKAVLQQFLKSLAACVTLGTGNSLGPEGPSVEIGASIAKGVGTLFGRDVKTKVPLVAAGSAAGIASGWNSSTIVMHLPQVVSHFMIIRLVLFF